jgi:hypothetical protein
MGEIKLPNGAMELLRYFEAVGKAYPSDDHWRNGAEMCRKWHLLLTADHQTQAEVDALLKRLESEPEPGSGWYDLNLQFRHWARSRGFVA